ncbi:class I SAM-dependent methyltransferase [Pacificibacter marinus]|uniref:Malonyl-[acyl-carrier protein] O-methyltransferase n=1 Tax=Pacificibacter marinus TaxID=658057 RepID=A0A1Y5T5F0_9RHOB|nr:class I SAM-dependent methyltransferase [Pacificibacter marinus]SEL20816.1 Methyltransferase domain-containing protein [Pacificibacter marinus]SLN55692.1 Malonyl-[acyl-carrier protein] O-methyltransferase [Pacificibacter marinus]
MTLSNRDLRDEIRDYWSDRAATFDDDPGHRIDDGAEMAAWEVLFGRHLGDGDGRALLDLASGTGEIARLCQRLGFAVTGLDWAEPMLERARGKLPDVTFLQADAERTTLPSASMDVIVTRHLVWTLVDPMAAFAEWFRVLKPEGKLLIVDGDFVSRSLLGKIFQRMVPNGSHSAISAINAARHKDILANVHFSGGARADQVAALLYSSGYREITIDKRLAPIHRAQATQFDWRKTLLRRSEHRYAISASKPQIPE